MQILDSDIRVRSLASAAAICDAPLACLLADAMAGQFHRWHGRSGARYTTSIYKIDHDAPDAGLPDLGPAVLIAVARHGAGRDIIGLMAIERDSGWAHAVARLHPGADEWHVHLLASDRAARAAVVADLGASLRMASVA